MDFATAWETLAIGDEAAVSNGLPPPSTNTNGTPYKVWASSNFSGSLVEKIDGDFRQMRFELVNGLGNTIGYTLSEGRGHSFEVVDP